MSMGMNAGNGHALTDFDHLRQSIAQILTTPIGSRIMRRSFGSLLPELIDQPLNEYTILQLYAATATALILHEPRLRLINVGLNVGDTPGQATVQIDGVTTFNGRQKHTSVSVPIRPAGAV